MDAKSWYKSKTLWGILIAFGAQALTSAGFTVGAEEQSTLVDMVMKIVEIGALAFAAYGRISSTKAIK